MRAKFQKFAAKRRRYLRILVLVAFSLVLLASFLPGSRPAPVNAQRKSAADLIAAAGAAVNSGILQTTTQPSSGTASPTTSGDVVSPFQPATPAPDGAIIHVVEEGQFLITIAQAYKISLVELFSLNNLTDQSVIYPGQKLFIKLADRTPEPIVTETSIPTTPTPPTPSPTRRPTRTPRSTALQDSEGSLDAAPGLGTPTPSAIPELAVAPTSQLNKLDPMLVLIGGLVGFGALMILFGTMFKRRN